MLPLQLGDYDYIVILMLDFLCSITHQSLDWWGFGRLYRVPSIMVTCILVA